MTASPVRSMRAMSKTGTDSSVTGERGDTASSAVTAFASACAAASAAEPSSREPDAGGETAGAAVAALVSTGGSRRRCMKPTTSAATHAATSAKYGTAVRPIDVAVIIHDPWLERWLVSPRVEPCADLFRSSSPPNGVSPPPHSAHTSADVDAQPWLAARAAVPATVRGHVVSSNSPSRRSGMNLEHQNGFALGASRQIQVSREEMF